MVHNASAQEPFHLDAAFLSEALQLPHSAILYEISRRLAALYAERFVLQGQEHALSLAGYAAAGLCELHVRQELHPQLFAHAGEQTVHYSPVNAWFTVGWQGHLLSC